MLNDCKNFKYNCKGYNTLCFEHICGLHPVNKIDWSICNWKTSQKKSWNQRDTGDTGCKPQICSNYWNFSQEALHLWKKKKYFMCILFKSMHYFLRVLFCLISVPSRCRYPNKYFFPLWTVDENKPIHSNKCHCFVMSRMF